MKNDDYPYALIGGN